MKNNSGAEAERVVEEALKLLVGHNPFFVKYSKSCKNGENDSVNKIDFIIFLGNFLALPIQVKGGKQLRKRIVEHYKKCPHVLAIGIRNGHNPEKIAGKLEKILSKILRNPRRIRVKNFSQIKSPRN